MTMMATAVTSATRSSAVFMRPPYRAPRMTKIKRQSRLTRKLEQPRGTSERSGFGRELASVPEPTTRMTH